MAKRLNPKRRLLAKQAALLAEVRKEKSAAHAVEMAMLQQGAVRSGMRANTLGLTHREPNWTSEDNRGKPKRPVRKVWSGAPPKGTFDRGPDWAAGVADPFSAKAPR